jgi:hypothetical protein
MRAGSQSEHSKEKRRGDISLGRGWVYGYDVMYDQQENAAGARRNQAAKPQGSQIARTTHPAHTKISGEVGDTA